MAKCAKDRNLNLSKIYLYMYGQVYMVHNSVQLYRGDLLISRRRYENEKQVYP
jgi:hypothetical protein